MNENLIIKLGCVVCMTAALGMGIDKPASAATNTYTVTLDTSVLSSSAISGRQPFSLAFQLTDGNTTGDSNNSITISAVNFGGGNVVSSATTLGGISGSISSAITLTDSLFLNYFIQQFVPGSQLSFQITATANLDITTPDQFSFSILDKNGQELATTGGLPFYNPLTTLTIDSANPSAQSYPLAPLLSIAKSQIVNFTQGQNSAIYTISVQNIGAAATSGTISAAYTVPSGFTGTSIAGLGWTCTLGTVSCSRADGLIAAGNYPPITITVNVASNAPSPAVNQVNVSGGGSIAVNASNPTSVLAPFADVSSGDAFLPAISLLREYSITSGCQASPPGYCPNDNISLGQMAVFVVRSVMGNDTFAYTPTPYFTDVPSSHPFFPWIQKMQDLGIALACAANQYCPDTPVTRGVMAVLIIRGRYGSSSPSNFSATPYFTDVPSSHPFFPWIQKMKQLGITSGCSLTTYCPSDPVTRGQMAVFIMRGAFNQLLPANTSVVVSVSSASLSPGQTVTVMITGQNTHFSNGVTQASAGGGITVSNISVANGTTLTAQLAVDSSATLGPRSITVTTGSEEATLPNGLSVQ